MQTGSFDEESRLWKRCPPNGALDDDGEYIDDRKAGEWRTYDVKGEVLKTTRHKRR